MQKTATREKWIIIAAVFVAGLCSIVYELLISTTSSYFLGDSVRQFSLTIGVYMAAMGLGSFLSKFMTRRLLLWFVGLELLLGTVGGMSVPLLYFSFNSLQVGEYQILMLGLTAVIGTLTGFEIPLLTRILKNDYPLRANLANVLSLDYAGALLATLLFPFLLLPFFGLFRTSVFFGLLNIVLGYVVFLAHASRLTRSARRWLTAGAVAVSLAFAALLWWAQPLLDLWESQSYSQQLIYTEQTPYQLIALTESRNDLRLYINRVIQFSAVDEYRYHEALALGAAAAVEGTIRQVLILGGGEGLLAREVAKIPTVEQITIVDLDDRIFALARQHPRLRALNEGILDDQRVQTVVADASQFLRHDTAHYDLVLADLPDPGTESVARLYSTWFIGMARARVRAGGVFATQATSPYHSREAYWCIYETVAAAGFPYVYPYHVYVPSFGDWGFVLGLDHAVLPDTLENRLPARYLVHGELPLLFHFPPDQRHPGNIRYNRLDQPTLLDYYLADWQYWQREKMQ